MTASPGRWRGAGLWPVCLPLLLSACATRSVDVAPLAPLASAAAAYNTWPCERLADELDTVQQRAADVAYEVDARVGANLVALGVGLGVFWPALLALRPDGPEAEELARLKGRFEALQQARQQQACPPPDLAMPAARAARWPLQPGERLVYEERAQARGAPQEWALQLSMLRRQEAEFQLSTGRSGTPDRVAEAQAVATWRQDLQGNVLGAPAGALRWQRLLRTDLALGQVLAGEFDKVGDPQLRARVRGQVVALGPQTLAGRAFDVAVIELFGDAQRGDTSTRLDGVLVVDTRSGLLLRLDLRSAVPEFNLQRRLVRIDARGAQR